MKWGFKNSIILSKISIILFSVIYIAVLVICTFFSRDGAPFEYWLKKGRTVEEIEYLRLVIYGCAVPLGAILVILYRLVRSIGMKEIFTIANIKRLRLISWLCVLTGAVCAVAVFYKFFFIFLAACAMFMAILLRVIKNVFERAKEIKEENDYTI